MLSSLFKLATKTTPTSFVLGKRLFGTTLTPNFSKLTLLGKPNVLDCMKLQDSMFMRMLENRSSFDFVRKRESDEFLNMINNNELYGVFNENGLVGIISMLLQGNETLLKHLDAENGTQIISHGIHGLLKGKNGAYLSCFMSDLDPNRKGLGSYILEEAGIIAKSKLKCDFLMGEIHVKNFASFNSLNKVGKVFSVSHKTVSFVNVKGVKANIPVFYSISLLNSEMIKILNQSINQDTIQNVKYDYRIITEIEANSKHSIDPVLKKDEIILFEDRLPKRVSFDEKKLCALLEKQNVSSSFSESQGFSEVKENSLIRI